MNTAAETTVMTEERLRVLTLLMPNRLSLAAFCTRLTASMRINCNPRPLPAHAGARLLDLAHITDGLKAEREQAIWLLLHRKTQIYYCRRSWA
jgi:hypothetical protein